MSWRRFLGPLRFAISGGLLAYLVWRADPAKIWESWRGVDLRLLGLALLLQLAGIALSAAKWSVLLRARGQRQPYAWLLSAYLVGQFANNFLPTTVGGDALRATQLGRRIGSFSQASASIFIERLTGFLALSLIANLALVLAYFDTSIQLVTMPALRLLTMGFALAAVAAMVASFGAPRLQRVLGPRLLPKVAQRPMQKVAQALADYAPQGRWLALVLGMSLLFQSLWIAIHLLCGLALGLSVPLLTYALMVPITDILGLVPIFVNNLGARDLVFTLYLSQVGVAPATAIALAFLIFSLRLVVSALGGLVALLGGSGLRILRIPQRDPLSAEP